jgi:hypothetical protein
VLLLCPAKGVGVVCVWTDGLHVYTCMLTSSHPTRIVKQCRWYGKPGRSLHQSCVVWWWCVCVWGGVSIALVTTARLPAAATGTAAGRHAVYQRLQDSPAAVLSAPPPPPRSPTLARHSTPLQHSVPPTPWEPHSGTPHHSSTRPPPPPKESPTLTTHCTPAL